MIDAEMSSPTFWEDGRKAQALVQERAELGLQVAGALIVLLVVTSLTG